MLDITPTGLFVNLVLGSIGLGLFMYGRKADRYPQMGAGAVLMVYPYFVSDTTQLVIGGLLVVGGLVAALWLDW